MHPDSVSVVIPTYNYGRFVASAVESALAQRWAGQMEVIVVDDGSTDDTAERLAPFGDRIRYIRQRNQGLPAARNTGIRNARYEWIALLDSDDVWHPDKTRVQLEAVDGNPAVGFVGTPDLPIADPATRLPRARDVRELGVRDFLVGTPLGPSSTMIRRRCFDKAGLFDETLRSVEDRDMWLRLAACVRGLQVKSPCWMYREHGGQMSKKAQRMFDYYKLVLDKFFREHPDEADLRRLAYGYMYLDASICFFDEGARLRSLGFLARSVAHWPGPFRGEPRRPFRRARFFVQVALGDRLFGSLRQVVFGAQARWTTAMSR
jgi:glycosyltransferase involved in cell wall biosynthesis